MGQPHLEAATSQALTCYLCGTAFWIEGSLYRKRNEDGRSFWCPNGHEQHFTETDAVRLKRQLELKELELTRARSSLNWAEKRAKGANIAAGIAKSSLRRTMERVHAGVCPHCQRTFKQLAAHMKVKHPGR